MLVHTASKALRGLFSACILAGTLSAQAAPFDCKPPNPFGTDVVKASTPVGHFMAWRCQSGVVQMIVMRRDYEFADEIRGEWERLANDTSLARLNHIRSERATGDWSTDPKLREVWLPFKAQIDALKAP